MDSRLGRDLGEGLDWEQVGLATAKNSISGRSAGGLLGWAGGGVVTLSGGG